MKRERLRAVVEAFREAFSTVAHGSGGLATFAPGASRPVDMAMSVAARAMGRSTPRAPASMRLGVRVDDATPR
jgi:hypothetical protein